MFDARSRKKRAKARGINSDNQKQKEKQEQNQHMSTWCLLAISWKSSSGKQKMQMHVDLPEGIYSRVIDRSASLHSHGGDLKAIITMGIGRCLACKL